MGHLRGIWGPKSCQNPFKIPAKSSKFDPRKVLGGRSEARTVFSTVLGRSEVPLGWILGGFGKDFGRIVGGFGKDLGRCFGVFWHVDF